MVFLQTGQVFVVDALLALIVLGNGLPQKLQYDASSEFVFSHFGQKTIRVT